MSQDLGELHLSQAPSEAEQSERDERINKLRVLVKNLPTKWQTREHLQSVLRSVDQVNTLLQQRDEHLADVPPQFLDGAAEEVDRIVAYAAQVAHRVNHAAALKYDERMLEPLVTTQRDVLHPHSSYLGQVWRELGHLVFSGGRCDDASARLTQLLESHEPIKQPSPASSQRCSCRF